MTLCIAAACTYKGRDAVVLGSDFMVEGTSKRDILDKLYWINNKEWPVLISGDDVSRAIELKEVYRIALEAAGDIAFNDLLDLMPQPLTTQKGRIADGYVGRRLGMSYAEFLERSRNGDFPESIRTETLSAVGKLKYKADIIIVVFVRDKTPKGRPKKYRTPIIFCVGDRGLSPEEQYACIGSGYDAADTFLAYREQQENVSAERTMFHVFEALAVGAAVAPGVGKGELAIVYDGGSEIIAEQPTGKYKKRLRDTFLKRLGPRTVTAPRLRPRDLAEF